MAKDERESREERRPRGAQEGRSESRAGSREGVRAGAGRRNDGERADSRPARSGAGERPRSGRNTDGERPARPARAGERSGERPRTDRRNAEGDRPGRAGAQARQIDGPRGRRDSGGWQPKQSLAEEIMGLDAEILNILSKRSMLLGKLRKGKAHAATPAVIRSEKEIRGAWEEQTARLGGNLRLGRQMFSLMQDLHLGQEEGAGYAAFNLSPARQPVEIDSPGPASAMLSQLWLALAASGGKPTAIHGLPRSAAVLDTVRAFEQTGLSLSWQGNVLSFEGKKTPDYHNKAIFVGEDLLTFYLFVFLGVSTPGKLRFTGGPALKQADLTALSRFLPSLGARLAWVVPGSRGLPVNLECSAVIPEEVSPPAGFPIEAYVALLLGMVASQHKVSLDLTALPATLQASLIDLAKCMFKILPGLGQALEHSIELNGYAVSELDFPPMFEPPLNTFHCGNLLALPIFTGGNVKLTGKWINFYQAQELSGLLKPFGLEIRADGESVSSSLSEDGVWPEALEIPELLVELHPLYWVLNARLAQRAKKGILLRKYPADADLEAAEDFLAQVGFKLEKVKNALQISALPADEFKNSASRSYGWPCPDALWGLALSLAAFMRSNLKLSNPDAVAQVLPGYWKFYNKLPNSKLRFAEAVEEAEAAPARRRIRTNTVLDIPEDDEADE